MKLRNTLEEAKFAVEVEDIGTVIVDGTSEGEVRSRVAKKLKGGKEAIGNIKKITPIPTKNRPSNIATKGILLKIHVSVLISFDSSSVIF